MISTLGIILLSSILLVITEAGCLKIARKQTQNDLMMGGWMVYDLNLNTSDRATMLSMARKAVDQYNKNSNDFASYSVTIDDDNAPIEEAYSQIVYGVNYCLRINVEIKKCKNGSDQCKRKNAFCEAKIYRQAMNSGQIPIVKILSVFCH